MKFGDRATQILGAALIFWGWQTGLVLVAVVPGGLLLLQPLTPWRFAWRPGLYQRLFALSVVLGVVLGGWIWIFPKGEIFILVLLRLSPLIFLPLALVMAFDVEKTVAPEVFSFRRDETSAQERRDGYAREWIFYFCIFITILAAGAITGRNPWFFPWVVVFMAVIFWPFRVRQGWMLVWFALFMAASAVGYMMQMGLDTLQKTLIETMPDYLGKWFYQRNGDSNHRFTDIGEVGRLKNSSRIVFRVYHEGVLSRPLLLQENAYDLYFSGGWTQTTTRFQSLPPSSPASAWMLHEGPAAGLPQRSAQRSTIYKRLNDEQGVLLHPAQTFRIEGLDVAILEKNRFGTLRYRDGEGIVSWTVVYDDKKSGTVASSEFASTDLIIPGSEKKGIDQSFEEAKLEGLSHDQVIDKLRGFFNHHFSYSLEGADFSNYDTPLAGFLLGSKRGHCEYFATASTLLLRRAGIPARYVFGYAVSEPDAETGWYLVRQRDAHAWTSVYMDGDWQPVDFTPPSWRVQENLGDSLWQPIMDSFAKVGFSLSQWTSRRSQTELNWVVTLGFLGVAGFVYFRLTRRGVLSGKNHLVRPNMNPPLRQRPPGEMSPFDGIIKFLEQSGPPRAPDEPLSVWIERQPQRPGLAELLRFYYFWRFDPMGLDEQETIKFRDAVGVWLDGVKKNRGQKSNNQAKNE